MSSELVVESWWLVNGLLGRANELRAGELAAAGKRAQSAWSERMVREFMV